ncbi:MAG: hypothetical protein WBI09_11065, partial [Methanothrix sp.]
MIPFADGMSRRIIKTIISIIISIMSTASSCPPPHSLIRSPTPLSQFISMENTGVHAHWYQSSILLW